jgi:hypothetical protein
MALYRLSGSSGKPKRHLFRLILLILALIGYANRAQSGEVIEATVKHYKGHFTIHTNILIQVPVAQARAILTRFENLPKVNNGISKVEILQRSDSGQERMRVESQVCMMFFCLDYHWVQEVEILPSGDIITRIDPALSDFREGWVRYQLLPEDSQTRLIMDADIVPDFWFPPLIGPLIIKSKLRDEALETAMGVERLANFRTSKALANRIPFD